MNMLPDWLQKLEKAVQTQVAPWGGSGWDHDELVTGCLQPREPLRKWLLPTSFSATLELSQAPFQPFLLAAQPGEPCIRGLHPLAQKTSLNSTTAQTPVAAD